MPESETTRVLPAGKIPSAWLIEKRNGFDRNGQPIFVRDVILENVDYYIDAGFTCTPLFKED